MSGRETRRSKLGRPGTAGAGAVQAPSLLSVFDTSAETERSGAAVDYTTTTTTTTTTKTTKTTKTTTTTKTTKTKTAWLLQ